MLLTLMFVARKLQYLLTNVRICGMLYANFGCYAEGNFDCLNFACYPEGSKSWLIVTDNGKQQT